MKRLATLLLCTVGAIGAVSAQPSAGVSIHINEPGVYGRIDLGDLPPPALVSAQPVVVVPPPVRVERRPIYLYVPPLHQQQWARYCARYAACGQPVYFVREDWVRERYVHEHPGWDRRHFDHHDFRDDRDRRGDHGRGRGDDRRD